MRKVCVVTCSRADYGHLYWILREIREDHELDLQLVATGSHLSALHGETREDIVTDGFAVDSDVFINLEDDSPVGIAKSTGQATAKFAEAIAQLDPDVVVLLGDRFEILAAAQVALILRIPIAHIHGGEVTRGAIDDSIRHAVTKMASVHFVAAQAYARRVIQLGEDPSSVFNVGAPGLEHVRRLSPLSPTELERDLEFSLGETNFLVTYHPVTATEADTNRELAALLECLDDFPEAKIVFTGVNADAGNRYVDRKISEFVAANRDRAIMFSSLGQRRYLSAMKIADVVIGNSSSGIIEAPALKTPSVNIGTRQLGRLKARSVIDCEGERLHIRRSIERALDPDFGREFANMDPPYGFGDAATAIVNHLKNFDFDRGSAKSFFDVDFSH